MHPAKSVIFFTTTSGAGYGLMIWLALLAPFGVVPDGAAFTVIAFALGVGLVIAGLVSSTLHLGRPERAWRALSQWRTSWLSREGLVALVTFVPALVWGLSAVTLGFESGLSMASGILTAGLAFSTVYCTGMIYASLKAVPAWHNDFTRAAYPLFSLMTGAALTLMLLAVFSPATTEALLEFAVVLFVAGGVLKVFYWRFIDAAAPTSTAASATGLGTLGTVSLFEKPHSGTNYLMREMGFHIARKHAAKLRAVALATGFAVPALALFLAVLVPALLPVSAFLAVVLGGVGIAVERWLFFAEARHVMTLYYGSEAV